MDPVTIGMGVSTLGSLVGSNNQKNAQKANQSAESGIDNQLVSIYNAMLKNYQTVSDATNPSGALSQAEGVFGTEASSGLSPQVIAAANANLQQQQQQGISSIRNQLGPALPNLAGSIRDFNEQNLTADVNENIGLAGQNQGVRTQGAQGLTGIANDVLGFGSQMLGGAAGGLSGLGAQFGKAASQPQTNPFSSLGTFLAQFGSQLGAPGSGSIDVNTPSGMPAPSPNIDPSLLSLFQPPSPGGSLGALPGLPGAAFGPTANGTQYSGQNYAA
jgi:hypothetical protein